MDLLEIWAHVAQDSQAAADRLTDRIMAKCRDLAQAPGMGRLREELAPRLRSFSVVRYVVYYRQAEDGITVMRVVHGSRDLGSVSFPES